MGALGGKESPMAPPTNNTAALGAINTSGYALFTISTENYIELFKNKEMDSYQRWFEKVYLEGGE